jgi:chemotaxis protein histidine kinase CheA
MGVESAMMKNKIACSAERLGLLDPQMIQSVVETNAFRIGRQYVAENRVRIVEADDSQITSAVIGNSGLYEQTVRLKEGHLISKCSCTLSEDPMCRHSIAVLLEYHRWVQPQQAKKAQAAKAAQPSPADSSANGKPAASQSSSPDVKLGEVMQFVEWLGPAMKAIDKGTEIPESPSLGPGDVSTWIQAIKGMEDRLRQSEEAHATLESEMRDREAYTARLTQQLQASIQENKAAQEMAQEQQREITAYMGLLTNAAGLAGEVIKFDGQLRAVAGELLKKGTQLDKMAGSFKEVTDALNTLTKKFPSK